VAGFLVFLGHFFSRDLCAASRFEVGRPPDVVTTSNPM
jgi:hypothetical protein